MKTGARVGRIFLALLLTLSMIAVEPSKPFGRFGHERPYSFHNSDSYDTLKTKLFLAHPVIGEKDQVIREKDGSGFLTISNLKFKFRALRSFEDVEQPTHKRPI